MMVAARLFRLIRVCVWRLRGGPGTLPVGL